MAKNNKVNVLDLSTFNLKTLDRVFMALVTIVLLRTWAALKCDQLPVTPTYVLFLFIP